MSPHDARREPRNLGLLCCLVIGLGFGSTGCAGVVYAYKANKAASQIESAKTMRAEEYAEYEYFYAKAHLLKAQEEAAEASYSDAIELADVAADYAQKAIDLASNAHRGAGR
jgi:hypothetical protein